ncbi:MAG TPA: SnoaL-like domain-containing protein [Puia sp.]|nr:SnoaL-like domain-containing protein [Puia sp.]
MTTNEIAVKYYDLMQEDKREQIVDELYSQDIVCKEPEHAVAMGIATITKGLDAVKAKSKARAEMIEQVHSNYCSEPVICGKFFSMILGRDITLKGKPRMNLQEIAVFEVMDGKIISEQFFY